MNKIFTFCLLILITGLAFSTNIVQGLVISHSIDMNDTVTISDDDEYIVYGRYSYDNTDTSVIYMSTYYNSVEVVINYKNNNVSLAYVLEIYNSGSWSEVKTVISTAKTGSTILINTAIISGKDYRIKVINPDNFLGRSSSIDVEWYAIR